MTKDNSSSDEDSQDRRIKRIRTPYEEQRLKLEKLMSHPERDVEIPTTNLGDEKLPRAFNPHEFVRNVMGK